MDIPEIDATKSWKRYIAKGIDEDTLHKILDNMSLIQRVMLRLRGKIMLGYAQRWGWKDKMPFYLFRCKIHGYQIGYPAGHNEGIDCPVCDEELRARFIGRKKRIRGQSPLEMQNEITQVTKEV